MRVLLQRDIGGFSLSDEALDWLLAHGCREFTLSMSDHEMDLCAVHESEYGDRYFNEVPLETVGMGYCGTYSGGSARCNTLLLQCFDELGDRFSSCPGEIQAVEIPDDVEWGIGENDAGVEWIFEKHRTWP